MGDFALPCFPLAKQIRKPPAAIAAELASSLDAPEFVSAVTPSGGYLNFTVEPSILCRDLMAAVALAETPCGFSTAK